MAALLAVSAMAVVAQDKTIILIRHAEKDTSAAADQNDPELSAEGKQRAERLARVIGRFKPGAFYSTNFKRTRETLAPWAAKRRKTVEIYDARKPQELIDKIMASPFERHIVAGHSNTIPGLANLLMKKELFRNLDDLEYGAIWIVRIREGKARKIELIGY